jgi:hypothetical protein
MLWLSITYRKIIRNLATFATNMAGKSPPQEFLSLFFRRVIAH